MKITFAARSDSDFIYGSNEDNLYCAGITLKPEERNAPFSLDGEADAPLIAAVFDGMGGISDGEVASLTAALALGDCTADITAARGDKEANSAVQRYVAQTNKLLCQTMKERASRLGTTLALVVVTDKVIRPYNLGDSRIYSLPRENDAPLRQVSVDHTLTAQKVKLGVLTPQQALTDRDRHVLSLHLGVFEDEFSVMAEELPPIPLDAVQRLMLCSDGLTDVVTDREIETILRSAGTISGAAAQLVKKALDNNAKDNITCIVIGH